MKLTLQGSIVSISGFNPAEGNNEGLYSADDAWPTLCLQGGDAVLNSGDLIGSPAADGRGCAWVTAEWRWLHF